MAAVKTPAIIRFDASAPLEVWPDFPESEISSGTRASIGHRWIDDKVLGFSAGIWEAEANLGRWMNWPVHEFMVILEGEVVMVEQDRETVIGAGESFFIPKGRRCIWNQSGYAKKFMVMFDDMSGLIPDGALPIVKIDPGVALSLCQPPPAEVLLSPVPTQQEHLYFQDATGQFSVGIWQTTGYHRKLTPSPRYEFMHILEGAVTLEDGDGNAQTFATGDSLMVRLGAANAWKSEGSMRKIYCIFQPNYAYSPRNS